jgi:hypothetical protein
MSGWCPRCDATRAGGGACPECGTPLVHLERQPQARPQPAEPALEVSAVAEAPPRSRLRIALAVAAVVLTGLAFVAGRAVGRGPGGAAVTTLPATETTTAEAAPVAQRRLDWQAKPVRGITLEAVSVMRFASSDSSTDDDLGLLTIRVQGLPAGQRPLGLQGLELLDVGGGVFAGPQESPVAGIQAAPVQPTDQNGLFTVTLGPTPGVDTLAGIRVQSLLVSRPPSGRNRIELDSAGSWPAKPPLRAVQPAADSVSIDLSPLRLRPPQSGLNTSKLPLQVAGAFVGSGRVVVTLRVGDLPGVAPEEIPQVFAEQIGAFPVSARLLAGDRVVCERTSVFGQPPENALLVAMQCPTAPAPRLAVELGAGAQSLALGAALPS